MSRHVSWPGKDLIQLLPPPKPLHLSSLSNLSVSSGAASVSRDELAARIRVKQEAREQQQDDNTNSVEAAKRKLAALGGISNSVSQHPAPRPPPPQYQQQSQPQQPPQPNLEQVNARNQEILKQLMVSSAPRQAPPPGAAPLQSAPQAYNINALAQGAILRHIQQTTQASPQQAQQLQQIQLQQQQVQMQAQQRQQQQMIQQQAQLRAQQQQQQQQQIRPQQPSAQLQQLIRVHAPPPAAVGQTQAQAMAQANNQVQRFQVRYHQYLLSFGEAQTGFFSCSH